MVFGSYSQYKSESTYNDDPICIYIPHIVNNEIPLPLLQNYMHHNLSLALGDMDCARAILSSSPDCLSSSFGSNSTNIEIRLCNTDRSSVLSGNFRCRDSATELRKNYLGLQIETTQAGKYCVKYYEVVFLWLTLLSVPTTMSMPMPMTVPMTPMTMPVGFPRLLPMFGTVPLIFLFLISIDVQNLLLGFLLVCIKANVGLIPFLVLNLDKGIVVDLTK